MRRFSHILSFLAVALFLLLVGNVAKANGVDPQIILDGSGSCATTQANPLQETSLTQAFTGLQTGCANDFQNQIPSGDGFMTLDTLVVNVTSPFTGQITCALGPNSPLNRVLETALTEIDAFILTSVVRCVPMASAAS